MREQCAAQPALTTPLRFMRAWSVARPPDRVRLAWSALKPFPLGGRLFGLLVGELAPYSGTIHAEVLELERGFARVLMRDRRRLRNHLSCLHAVALSNLAEFTGNLALAFSIPGDARFIVTSMSTEYMRKARGPITAVCACDVPDDNRTRDLEITVELFDAGRELVARAALYSRVGPVTSRADPVASARNEAVGSSVAS